MGLDIIDMFCMIPTKEYLKQLVTLPPQEYNYVHLFGKKISDYLGISAEFQDVQSRCTLKELNAWMFDKISTLAMEPNEFVELLDTWGVRKAVLMNEDNQTTTGLEYLPNDYFANLVNEYPDKFLAFAAVDPHKKDKGLNELERSISELGLHGYTCTPFLHGLYANDKMYEPFFDFCQQHNIPVWIHASMNFSSLPSDYGHPRYLDDVALKFPNLKIIAGHGGWPWVLEMTALARKHKNLYIDTSTQRPRHLARAGSGWEPLLYYGDNLIQDQIVFGSTWILLGLPIDELAQEVDSLPLKEHIKMKWLVSNAKRLLNL